MMNKKNKKLVPKLRFSGFSGEWNTHIFSKLYDFGPTNSLSRNDLLYKSNGIFNIHYGDIHTKFKTSFHLNEEKVPIVKNSIKISRESLVSKGDIIIADASEDYSDIGKTIEIMSISNDQLISGLHTIFGKNKNRYKTIGFVGQLMRSPMHRLRVMKIAQGTKVLGIPKKYVKDLVFYMPDNYEQQKVTSFLSSTDNWIENLEKQKASLEKYKKSMMQKIFSQEIRFENEDGNDYPEWREVLLGDVSDIYDGTHQTPKYVKEGISFYSVEHVTSDDFENTKFITKEVYEKEIEKVRLEKYDILMTRIGNIGTVKLIDWDVKASFYVSLALIKKSQHFNSSYLTQYINSEEFQREVWRLTIHVAFPKKINLGEINKCTTRLPELEEQQKVALFLSSIDKLIKSKDNQVKKAKQWKKGLLQKMFV